MESIVYQQGNPRLVRIAIKRALPEDKLYKTLWSTPKQRGGSPQVYK